MTRLLRGEGVGQPRSLHPRSALGPLRRRICCKICCQTKEDFASCSEGSVSSVAGIRPSLFAGTLGVYYFPHDENTKLPCKRCCSEVNLGRTYLLSAMCIEMRNLAPRIIISHGKY